MYFQDRKQGEHINKQEEHKKVCFLKEVLNTLSGTSSSPWAFYTYLSTKWVLKPRSENKELYKRNVLVQGERTRAQVLILRHLQSK